jgi:hypothetical protein
MSDVAGVYVANGFAGIGPLQITGLLDPNAADITPIVLGQPALAGAIGLAADSGHQHPYPGTAKTPNLEILLLPHDVPFNSQLNISNITIPVGGDGWYEINANIAIQASSGFVTSQPGVALLRNGHTAQLFYGPNNFAHDQVCTVSFSRVLFLSDGETISLQYLNNATSGGVATFAPGEVGTSIASASNNVTLPAATINVLSTASFPAGPSTAVVINTTGGVMFNYTATTGTQFTGCTGGEGTLNTGDGVGTAQFSSFQATFLHE